MPSTTSPRTNPAKLPSSLIADLPRRVATVSIGLPTIYMILSIKQTAWLFFFGALALACWEWSRFQVVSTSSDRSMRILFCIASLLLASLKSSKLFQLALYAVFSLFIATNRDHYMCGLIFIVIPFRAWLQLSQDFPSCISLLLTVWNCDTGALVSGRLAKALLGDDRRIPVPAFIRRISPAKSMEGFVGGILFGILTSVYLVPWMSRVFIDPGIQSNVFDAIWISSPFVHRIGFGTILSILGIVGDLIESATKRNSKIKDSGKLIPGHGGVLDRFDSTLLAVLFYGYAEEYVAASLAQS